LLSSDICVMMTGMNNLIKSFTDYLYDVLGVKVKPEEWDGYRYMPVFLQNMYQYFVVQILNEKCLLLVNYEKSVTPATLRKHYELIRRKWSGPVVVVREYIRSNDRQRMIVDYKLPFVVPGNQLYLPDIGLDIREHFRRVRKEGQQFSPSTQLLVLHVLLTRNYAPLTSTELLNVLPYTPMTIKRAFDEIALAKVGTLRARGRERELRFEVSGLKLWDAALPFLRSPVQKRVATVFEPSVMPTLKAGLTALSTYSMILASSPSTLAISPEAWKTAKVNVDIYDVDYEDDNAYNLEIWRYDPFVLSSTNAVDRLSLFLSLRDTNDERIEAALDEMMEGVEW
jgi:hypothetical protein